MILTFKQVSTHMLPFYFEKYIKRLNIEYRF